MTRNIASIAFAALALTASGTVRYVTPTGSGDGSSWDNALPDLQQAIDASESGDQVWVVAGIYKPSTLIKSTKTTSKAFILKEGVSLYGGFKGYESDPSQRQTGTKPYDFTNATILSADDDITDEWIREIDASTTYRWSWQTTADNVTGTKGNSTHVVYCPAAFTAPTAVDGFTLTGANANIYQAKAAGGAVYGLGTLNVANCRIIENSAYFTAEGDDCNTYGGAVYLDGGSLTDCLVEKAYSHSSFGNGYGGGVYAKNAAISGCDFIDCVGLDGGGGVYMYKGTLENCTFRRCYASAGGAIYNNGGTVKNVDIADCRGLNGGGLFVNGYVTDALVRGCYADAPEYGENGGKGGAAYLNAGYIAGLCAFNNTANEGGGVYMVGGRVINATVLNNSARSKGTNLGGDGASNIFNSISEAGTALSNFVAPTAFSGFPEDNAAATALLGADWQLAPGSQFIDAGTAVEGFDTGLDLAGNPRVSGNAIDCGAYEFVEGAKVPTIILTFAEGTQAAKLALGGAGSYEFTVDWGDGKEETYNAQAYYTHLLYGNTVKVYGDDIILLRGASQGIVAADLSRASKLQQVMLGSNGMASLVLADHPSLTGLYAECNNLTALNVAGCPALKVLDVHENMIASDIDCSAMASLSKVDIADNQVSTFILPKHSTVYDVDCSRNKLTQLDVTGLSGLDSFAASENALTELDLTGLDNVYEIYVDGNRLASLDLSPCKELSKIMAAENAITSIDLSVCPTLSGVYLQDNALTAIDLTKNANVRWLNINNNAVGQLNVSAQTYLSILNAAGNNLSAIDLSANKSLSSLDLSGNNLASVDISNAGYLSQCHLENNALTELNTSKNPYLYGLFCGGNALTALDITANTYLQRLEAQGNKLTALDLSKNTGLQSVYLQSNAFEAAALESLASQLQDVTGVSVTPETESFLRKLDVSYNPGTEAADLSAAVAKGWYVTADYDAEEEITPVSLNVQVNRMGSTVYEVSAATIEWGNEEHTSLWLQDFNGSGARIVATLSADGNVKIAPQVAGGDAEGNFYMIVNEASVDGNPMAIYATNVEGHFDGTTLTLQPWNLIIVPYTFAENLGTVYPSCLTSTFHAANGTMSYGSRTFNTWSEVDAESAVTVYGWAGMGAAKLTRNGGKWEADPEFVSCIYKNTEFTLTTQDEKTLESATMPDARTLTFGAWMLGGGSYSIEQEEAILTFNFDLPSVSTGIEETDAEVVETVYTNAAGVRSAEPFNGFNIVTLRRADGTVTTKRILIRK